jgi:hypothetical protein
MDERFASYQRAVLQMSAVLIATLIAAVLTHA